MTADDFRDIALSLPGAVERAHMGHPDFRAKGKIFASLHASGASATVKLSREEQQELMRVDPDTFMPASGAWGRQGWTIVELSRADKASARGALMLAWQNVAGNARTPRSAPKPGARQRPRTARTRRG